MLQAVRRVLFIIAGVATFIALSLGSYAPIVLLIVGLVLVFLAIRGLRQDVGLQYVLTFVKTGLKIAMLALGIVLILAAIAMMLV